MERQHLKYLFLLLCISQHLKTSYSANILFFWGMTGYSHRITIWPLVEKLADKGHNITFLSPHTPKTPTTHKNVTELILEDLFTRIGMDYDPAEVRIRGGTKAVENLWPSYLESGVKLCEILVTDQKIQNWANDSSYDLVVVNGLFNDCGYAFAHKFRAKTIVFSTTSVFQWWGEVYGYPEENYPEFHYHLPLNMTFLQQVWNTFTPLYWLAIVRWQYLPELEKIIARTPFLHDKNMPSLVEMNERNSLVFVNTHFSEEFARSLPPWIISVGGMQCSEKTNPLPTNIENFVEKWENGFIYFSLGTYMKLPLLPQAVTYAIFGAIRKFPSVGFVLKWNGGETPKEVPQNVFLAEWLAQQDILAHPKIRAFISHGGLLSTHEATFHAVPVVVFPIFAEQDYNAQRIHSMERGIMMEISEVTEDKLEAALKEILTNKKYKRNMEQVSKVFRDRPQKPVDTAAWWVEYALRHQNTSYLRPIGVTRTWYERRMLHIWGFVAVVVFVALLSSLILIRATISLIVHYMTEKKSLKIKNQ